MPSTTSFRLELEVECSVRNGRRLSSSIENSFVVYTKKVLHSLQRKCRPKDELGIAVCVYICICVYMYIYTF